MKTNSGDFLIKLDNVTIRLYDKLILQGTNWTIKDSEHWAVLGPNGSGKSSLVKAIAGRLPVVHGKIIKGKALRNRNIGYVAFDVHLNLLKRENRNDYARYFSGRVHIQTTVHNFLASDAVGRTPVEYRKALALFGMDNFLEREIRTLSNGEMRKILIIRALIEEPRLLILDEPYDGLDLESRKQLSELIGRIVRRGIRIVLVTHRREEIITEITHVLLIKNLKLVRAGDIQTIFSKTETRNRVKPPIDLTLYQAAKAVNRTARDTSGRVLIEMKNVSVRYGQSVILEKVNWTVLEGQNWLVAGPNGAGKSTLISLITGDHPQAYTNEIYLFGRRRGSGESIWDIKQHIGHVSSELQYNYQKAISVLEIVLSGFFDSLGLFRRPSPGQIQTARRTLEMLGMGDFTGRRFDQLSFGEQRMVLIARAVVKAPELLILDEPCQGLDQENRGLILGLIDLIGKSTPTGIIYVTHYPQEIPACITGQPKQPAQGLILSL